MKLQAASMGLSPRASTCSCCLPADAADISWPLSSSAKPVTPGDWYIEGSRPIFCWARFYNFRGPGNQSGRAHWLFLNNFLLGRSLLTPSNFKPIKLTVPDPWVLCKFQTSINSSLLVYFCTKTALMKSRHQLMEQIGLCSTSLHSSKRVRLPFLSFGFCKGHYEANVKFSFNRTYFLPVPTSVSSNVQSGVVLRNPWLPHSGSCSAERRGATKGF